MLDVNKLQQQKQTPKRTQKVPRVTPLGTDYGSVQKSPGSTEPGRKGRGYSRHEGAPEREPESPVGPEGS